MTELEFYRDKRVLVTGHTGFKGFWLCKLLKAIGAEVIGLSDSYIFPQNEELIKTAVRRSYTVDILEQRELENVILNESPDFVFHFAAQSLVRRSYVEPKLTWNVNLIGTLNVIHACQMTSRRCVLVCATTDKVYRNEGKERRYFTEQDELGGYDPYSASKAACELLINSTNFCAKSLANSDIVIKSVRAGNVVGGADWSSDRIIPDIIRATMSRETLIVRNPNAIRPWQHVLDCCVGYLKIGIYGGTHSTFNVGPSASDAISVQNIIDLGYQFFDFNLEINASPDKPEKQNLELDTSLMKTELKFEPKITGSKIFAETFSWYKKFLNEKSCIADLQIYNYLNDQ